MDTYIKIDDNTIHVTKEDGTVNEFKYDFLLQQKDIILKQRDAELAFVDKLLGYCTELGLDVVVEEEVIVEPEPVVEEPIVEKKSVLSQLIEKIKGLFN